MLIRLCVTGIYPREPRNKKKASKSSTASTTFYYTKDIQYLLHEPLLAKFRDHKALAKKIARSLGRGEVGDAARLEKRGASGPGQLSLDHIIKERHPTFVDALRDLDDALSLLFLFANLPSTSTVPPKTIALCQRLYLEFQHYLITTNSLQKSFLSIKGIYYQATIQGQDILWLVPYKFVQRVTGDVDFRIMGTFVEFYTTLLGFVNFRLYTSVGLIYPPRFNSKSDEQGAELDAFTLEGRGIDEQAQIETVVDEELENGVDETHDLDEETQRQIAGISAQEPNSGSMTDANTIRNDEPMDTTTTDTIDAFPAPAPDADDLLQPSSSTTDQANLFAPYTFYVSRECPRAPLEFLLRAFGCKRIGWDSVLGPGAFTHDEANPSITHQIVDRPPLSHSSIDVSSSTDNTDHDDHNVAKEPAEKVSASQTVKPGHRIPGRTYVQPQWVWDSINAVKCLRPDLYAPGATLPPHLSPWVKPTKGQYDPSLPLAEQEKEGEAEAAAEELDEDETMEGVEDEREDEEAEGTNGTGLNGDDTQDGISHDDGEGEHGMTVGVASDTDEDEEDDDNDDGFVGFDPADTASNGDVANRGAGNDDDEVNNIPDQTASQQQQHRHQRELEAEASGRLFTDSSASTTITPSTKADDTPLKSILKPSPSAANNKHKNAKQKQDDEEDEELTRRKMMLGTRKRKLVEKMLFANRKAEKEAENLRAKRRRIEMEMEGKKNTAMKG